MLDRSITKRMYAVGVPATLNLALPSLLISCLNIILAGYSQVYVLVLGVYYKLQTFLYLPANGIVQGMRPIVGYNYGAREYGRVRRIFFTGLALSAGIMVAGTVLCGAVPGSLIGLFSTNAETIAAGSTALRIISIGFIISSVSVISCGALEGLGMGRSLSPHLPAAVCGAHHPGGLLAQPGAGSQRRLARLLGHRGRWPQRSAGASAAGKSFPGRPWKTPKPEPVSYAESQTRRSWLVFMRADGRRRTPPSCQRG